MVFKPHLFGWNIYAPYTRAPVVKKAIDENEREI